MEKNYTTILSRNENAKGKIFRASFARQSAVSLFVYFMMMLSQ